MKKISIIIPVYNCEKYLVECFQSIENQNFKKSDFEVIIVNDGSKDNSLQLIKKYCLKNKTWQYIDQKNQGLSMARNNGLELVDSKYVTFLDSDDTLPEDALSKLYESIIDNDADMVIGGLINYNSSGFYDNYTTKYLINKKCINYYDYRHLLDFVHSAGKLYKYSRIKNIKFIKGLKHEDNYFTGTIFLNDFKINMIDSIVYNHRVREGLDKSITQSLNFSSFNDYLENINHIIDENKYSYIFCKTYLLKIYNYIFKYVERENEKKAKIVSKKLVKKMIMGCSCNIIRKKYLFFIRKVISFFVFILKKLKGGNSNGQ